MSGGVKIGVTFLSSTCGYRGARLVDQDTNLDHLPNQTLRIPVTWKKCNIPTPTCPLCTDNQSR